MKKIASRENPDYRLLTRVLAGRRTTGERTDAVQRIGLEGLHLCESWLASHGQPELAFVDEQRLAHPEVAAIVAKLDPSRVRQCAPALLRSASQVVQGQGLVFVAHAPQPPAIPRIDQNCLWLDRVQDPGNMGSLLRTAAAAGMKQVYASKGCVAAWSAKVLRSAQGAHFRLDIHEGQDLHALRERLEIPLLVTALHDAQVLYQAELPAHAAWVFGNEGRGVEAGLTALADQRLYIPQSPAVESLNVGVAAGICLFEQRRRFSWS